MADATHASAIRSGQNWKPPFLTLPLQCYYIEQTYAAGALTGGGSITSDASDVEIFLEGEYSGAAHWISKRRTLFCFLEEPIDFTSLPSKYAGSYCNWEGMVVFPQAKPDDDSAYATIDRTAATIGSTEVISYGYWLDDAYSAAFAWNNLPTLNQISYGWAAGANAEHRYRASIFDGQTVSFERFMYQPPAVRYKYANGNPFAPITGFALELDLVNTGGSAVNDTNRIQIGKFACTGPAHHLNTFQYPYGGWFHLYWVSAGRCV